MTYTSPEQLAFPITPQAPPVRVTVLRSGSSGNSLLLQLPGAAVLVDVGIGKRDLTLALAQARLRPEDLAAILVTHEHSDHVSGITWLATRLHIPIYATRGSWIGDDRSALAGIRGRCDAHTVVPGTAFELGGASVHPFATSHDTQEPCGYRFDVRGIAVTVATDLGVVTPAVREHLAGADLVVFEANHDPQMLRDGPYPWFLKKRIMGERGHLSNSDAGRALSEVPGRLTRQVVLAHLSSENNLPDLALRTVADALGGTDNLHVAKRRELTGPFVVA